MNHKGVVKKAIKKAMKNGFEAPAWYSQEHRDPYTEVPMSYITHMVYNHDFAKALWGDLPLTEGWYESEARKADEVTPMQRYVPGTSAWKYHLQQMVIANDAIAYLKANM